MANGIDHSWDYDLSGLQSHSRQGRVDWWFYHVMLCLTQSFQLLLPNVKLIKTLVSPLLYILSST